MRERADTRNAYAPAGTPGRRERISAFDHVLRILPTEPDSPRALVIAFAAFLSMFTTFGVVYSFGAFVKPMAAEFHSSRAAISAVFSITAFIYFIFGAAAGHISDRIGPRPVMVASALFMGAGLVWTSRINHLSLS